jgi:hypothetical protein
MQNNDILNAYFDKARKEDVDLSLKDIQSIVDKGVSPTIPTEGVVKSSFVKQIIFNTKYTLLSVGVVSTIVTSVVLWSFTDKDNKALQAANPQVELIAENINEQKPKEQQSLLVETTKEETVLVKEELEELEEAKQRPIQPKQNASVDLVVSPVEEEPIVEEESQSEIREEQKEALVIEQEQEIKEEASNAVEEKTELDKPSVKTTERNRVKSSSGQKISTYEAARAAEIEKQRLRNKFRRDKIKGFEIGRKTSFLGFKSRVYLKHSLNKTMYHDISLLIYNEDQWAKVNKKGQKGFIDETGQEVVRPKYERIYQFGTYKADWAKVQKNGLFGFLDREGVEIVKAIYDEIFFYDVYRTGWAMVKRNGLYGFIDENGVEVVPVKYSKISFYDVKRTNWAEVEINGKHGFIDIDGHEVVKPVYDRIFFYDVYRTGWAMVKKDKKYGFIDMDGNEPVASVYDKIFFFDEYRTDWAMVLSDKKYGFINNNGEELVAPKYDKIFHFDVHKTDWAKVKLDKHYGFIDINGKEVLKPEYTKVGYYNGASPYILEKDGQRDTIRVEDQKLQKIK